MGFFSKLFGGSAPTPPPNAQSNARRSDTAIPGSKESPWVCEPPPNLAEMRKLVRKSISGNGGEEFLPDDKIREGMDVMIAEMLKMALLKEIFGEEGKDWECGTRMYLKGSIQSQKIVFKNGRPPVTFYTDFSKFGAF